MICLFLQAEDGIRDLVRSRGLGDVYKRQRQGGLRAILSTPGGAQESLLVEGIGTLADRLAEGLGPRIRLADPGTPSSHTDGRITRPTPPRRDGPASSSNLTPPAATCE